MLTKCETWPKVLPNNNGIRPAGEPDKCFYCARKVGQAHAEDCVCVLSRVRYGVYLKDELVGSWRTYEPVEWDTDFRELHKNELTWCAENAVDSIEWASDNVRETVASELEKHVCLCGVLTFRVEEIEDAGPFVELREDSVAG